MKSLSAYYTVDYKGSFPNVAWLIGSIHSLIHDDKNWCLVNLSFSFAKCCKPYSIFWHHPLLLFVYSSTPAMYSAVKKYLLPSLFLSFLHMCHNCIYHTIKLILTFDKINPSKHKTVFVKWWLHLLSKKILTTPRPYDMLNQEMT